MAVLLRSPVEHIGALESSMGAARLYTPAEAAVRWKIRHMQRVGDVVADTLDKIGVETDFILIGGVLGHLHDIACAHNPRMVELTNAPRVLEEWERAEVRIHAQYGAQEAYKGLSAITEEEQRIKAGVVTSIGVHHDDLRDRRVSSKQYPAIDLTELVETFKMADGMDALTDSDRPYSVSVPLGIAAEMIALERPGDSFFETSRAVVAQHMAEAFSRQRE